MKAVIYRKIAQDLRYEISQGNYRVGMQLPSEADLCQQYEVSRITAKHALDLLENEKIIRRVQGKGSIVQSIPGKAEPVHPAPVKPTFIGLILPDFTEYFGLEIVRVVEKTCAQNHLYCVLKRSEGSIDTEQAAIKELLAMGVSGFIIMPVNGEYYNPHIIKLILDQFPVVVIDRQIKGFNAGFVGTDNINATKSAMKHLFALGHRHIAWISPPTLHTSSLEDRQRAFQDAFVDCHCLPDPALFYPHIQSTLPLKDTDQFRQVDINNLQTFFKAHPQLTAVFASEHLVARLIEDAASTSHLRIPDDFSLVFFDAPKSMAYSHKYTYIRQDEKLIAQTAVEQLLQAMKPRAADQRREPVFIPGSLIVGDSTAAPPVHH
ncbi:GntR family transcriptional regulator [Oscillospiraceae bacterium HV4-5-C5C]|nr:GntR family transcriptional regulator [Oscillospiraceae bacterium HV4-5-C5C]